MDKFILAGDDIPFVMDWFEKNKDILPQYPPVPLSELKIQFVNVRLSEMDPRQKLNATMTIQVKEEDVFRVKIYRADGKRLASCKILSGPSLEIEQNEKIKRAKDLFQTLTRLLGEDENEDCSNLFKELESGYDFRILEQEYSRGFDKEIFGAFFTVFHYLCCFVVYYRPQKVAQEASAKRTYHRKDASRTEHKENRNEKEQTIVFRDFVTEIDAHGRHSTGKYRKVMACFSVRGHWRHYSDGRKIWIKEYSKGTGPKKDKQYRIERKK